MGRSRRHLEEKWASCTTVCKGGLITYRSTRREIIQLEERKSMDLVYMIVASSTPTRRRRRPSRSSSPATVGLSRESREYRVGPHWEVDTFRYVSSRTKPPPGRVGEHFTYASAGLYKRLRRGLSFTVW